MKITFHGGAGTVTGSQHLLEVNGRRILLDCGLYQGRRKEAYERNRRGDCPGSTVDCLVLSHAHIDHSGSIPCLVKNGFAGDIYATTATRDLCAIMLLDSANIQERDVEYVNILRKKQGKALFEPLYTTEDVVRSMQLFVGVGYGRPREIAPGVTLTLVDAGHLLGSAHVVLDISDRETGRDLRLVFSGDIGRPGIPIIRDPVPLTEGADVVIMESTYGSRTHPPYEESSGELKRIANETAERGGSLVIPAFAVGRTQQIVYDLHKLADAREIPALPIYVDSPMATRVTEIYRLHTEVYDREVRDFLVGDPDRDPFGFSALKYTQSVEESKELNFLRTPAVIISASGMLEGGRILHHLKNRISDSRTTVLITGWQAPHTLGRRLVEGTKSVPIFGRETPVRARIEVMTGLSGHADRDGLLRFVEVMERRPGKVFVVHGEEEGSTALAAGLKEHLGIETVHVPAPHETAEV